MQMKSGLMSNSRNVSLELSWALCQFRACLVLETASLKCKIPITDLFSIQALISYSASEVKYMCPFL